VRERTTPCEAETRNRGQLCEGLRIKCTTVTVVATFFVECGQVARIEPVGFRVKSDLRTSNHQAISQ
jgi:hypothetical protein